VTDDQFINRLFMCLFPEPELLQLYFNLAKSEFLCKVIYLRV